MNRDLYKISLKNYFLHTLDEANSRSQLQNQYISSIPMLSVKTMILNFDENK